jgi:hypothetical protein
LFRAWRLGKGAKFCGVPGLFGDAAEVGRGGAGSREVGNVLVDAVTPALADKYGQWDYFKYMVERNILETEAELNGTKRVPQPIR